MPRRRSSLAPAALAAALATGSYISTHSTTGEAWLAARAGEVVSFYEAPRTARHARMLAEHIAFEQARAKLLAALAAAGLEVSREVCRFGDAIISTTVPRARVAIAFREQLRSTRIPRAEARRAAAVTAAGWRYMSVTPADVATTAKLRAVVRRIAEAG